MFRKFGPSYRTRLTALLMDPAHRSKIKEFYELIWSDHNLVSMALYAGPRDFTQWQGNCLQGDGWRHHYVRGYAVGWLGTGDMHLNGVRRRNAMISHYRGVLDQVNVFGLPHHGSHRNFHASLPGAMQNMTQCVAAAGPNGYGHPHKQVIDAVHSAGRQFVQVNDSGPTTLLWKHSR